MSQFSRLHGSRGVMDIMCHTNGYVYSCGRDGQYAQFEIIAPGQLELRLQRKVS